MIRLLVCGGREWGDSRHPQDGASLFETLDDFVRLYGLPEEVIEGCQRGADRLAEQWAESRGYPLTHYPADWKHLGKAAGRFRNVAMLGMGQPTHVVAFHHSLSTSKGTAHMVQIAREAGVPTFVFPSSH